MNHVWTIGWRPARLCVQSSKTIKTTTTTTTPTDPLGLRQAFSALARVVQHQQQHRAAIPSAHAAYRAPAQSFLFSRPVKRPRPRPRERALCTTASPRFQQACGWSKARRRKQQQQQQQQIPPQRAPPSPPPPLTSSTELAFRRNDLRTYEVKVIFGPNAPPIGMANSLLRVLHCRRVNGTLDLDLPPHLAAHVTQRYPDAVEDGLRWLRREHPVDEDAAILRRIEREEADEDILIHRAETLGLYKPQGGLYGARPREHADVYGESQLDRIRRENELKAEREQRELEEFIEQKMRAAEEKTGPLEVRREDGLEVSTGSRPPNSFEKWRLRHYLSATSKTTYEQASQKGKLARLLSSFLFAAAVTLASYIYAVTWTPPDQATRMMASQSIRDATILGIISINLALFGLWNFPPAWRLLNRYFITTTAVVRPLSHLGNIFSHQEFGHIATNMLLLWIIGPSLHEQVNRGEFLAIYLSSGVVASVVSLTNMVLRNMLHTCSLGASGAVSGILAAYCTINPHKVITLWPIPEEWRTWLSCEAGHLLYAIVIFEIISMTVPFLNRGNINHVAHLGGYAMGLLGGLVWNQQHGTNSNADAGGGGSGGGGGPWGANRSRDTRWYEKVLGR